MSNFIESTAGPIQLGEVQRIENAKRQLSMTTEERIREIQRVGFSELLANEDRERQVAEYQQKAGTALASVELEQSRQFAKKAMGMAAQVATSQTSEAKHAEAVALTWRSGRSSPADRRSRARSRGPAR